MTETEFEVYADELNLVVWFRATSGNGAAMNAVRAALADVLESGASSSPALSRAVSAMYADPSEVHYLETFEAGWAACDKPALRRCAEMLRDARSDLWNSARDELQ